MSEDSVTALPNGREGSKDCREGSKGGTSARSLPKGATMDCHGRWRRQDEKSQRSVKDKIAMFSSEHQTAAQTKAKKARVGDEESEKCSMKRSMTQDDVRIDSVSNGDQGSSQVVAHKVWKPIYTSMVNVHSCESDGKEKVTLDVDLRPDLSSTLTSKQIDSPSGLKSRSQSLSDVGGEFSQRMKRHSVGAFDRPSMYKYGIERPEERERRTSLNNMIEQRRKSISKLRGLVIPESRNGESVKEPCIPIDLPKISSQHRSPLKTMSLTRDESRISKLYKADSGSSIDSSCSSISRKSSSGNSVNRLQKVSPQNNRKHCIGALKTGSLPPVSYRLNRNPSPVRDFSSTASTTRRVSPSERALTPSSGSDASCEIDNKFTNDRFSYVKPSLTGKTAFEGKFNKSEDSDNDSAVSSTQSSFSQSLSPRASPTPDHYDADDQQSPTQSSISNHSPLSSCDELDSRRILKNGTIEAENRRNILKSAKCSSGRSSDEQSTPEIIRKFSKEPAHNFHDRLNSELKDNYKRVSIKRDNSVDSSTSISTQSSRRNSRDSVGHVGKRESSPDCQSSKDLRIKSAYLSEIIDNLEELNDSEVTTLSCTKVLEDSEFSAIDKWSVLEQKYGKQNNFENRIRKYICPTSQTERNRAGPTSQTENTRAGGIGNKADFRAVADKWKQRTNEVPNSGIGCRESEKVSVASDSAIFSLSNGVPERNGRPSSLNLTRKDASSDRRFSTPEFRLDLQLREKGDECPNDASLRPKSLIDDGSAIDPLRQDGHFMTTPVSPSSTSTDFRDDLDSSEASLSRTGSKEVLDAFSKPCFRIIPSPKISEIMKAFERHDIGPKGPSLGEWHPRMSSLDSNASDDGFQGGHYGSISSLASGQRDQYGSITSLASSTSIISPQELAQLIEEANHSLEESGTPSHEILVVVLHREVAAHGSIGITLAGGADYETKEITIHKVIPGSLADRDGRIQKGDRVLSINGKTLRGVTHREALYVLKSPRPEVVLVLSRSRSVTPQESTITSSGDAEFGFSHRPHFINHIPPPRPPKILESPMDSKSLVSDSPCDPIPRGSPMTITLVKDGAGLGFSLEGGKDSPLGDRPLTVKKIFTGGSADKGGVLVVGDELLSINNVDLTNMARIEAWNFLKKLADGTVTLVIRKKLSEVDLEKRLSS